MQEEVAKQIEKAAAEGKKDPQGELSRAEAQVQNEVAKAMATPDAEAKKALFKEAVYLGIQPDLFSDIRSDLDPGAP